MTISVLSAARLLGLKSGWTLSNLELQKIIYLAHMFYLGRAGQPLVAGNFEAWDYGPIHPSLYHRAKVFGSDPVGNVFHDAPNVPEGAARSILEEAYEKLGSAGPGRLVKATHRPNGAWAINYIPGVRGRVISNHDILAEYRMLSNAEAPA